MYYSLFDSNHNVCTKCDNVIENNECIDSCSLSLAPNKNNVCKPCVESTMIYKLDGRCISQCPPEYESKVLYGDKNICSLIISHSDCYNLNCSNDVTCSQELGSPNCKCKEGFYGKNCDYDQYALENM